MAINFPDNPTNGQVALVDGKNYTYNSTKNTWTPTQVTEADLSTVGSTTVVATHDLLPSSPSAGDMALVSSVNKMYVYFLSGWWLMSSLQNASPSGITGNAAIYDLAADGTPTTVTLSSSDPEGFPIVWTHSVISGSLGGTTVTNVNNVFTITPSTDAADAGTFTLRFAAADGQGGESGSQSNFTLDFVFTVTNSRYTTLLATATDTSDNNNITDSSSNVTLTPVGDTTAGTFSPHRSGGYSMNFGSGASLNFAEGSTSDFNMGTNAFTIEMWIRPPNTSSGSRRFYQNRISSMGNGKGSIYQNGTGLYATYRGDNGTDYELSATSVLSANTWTHVCLLRNTSDNTLKLYYNGTLGQSVSVPSTVGIYSSNSNTQIGLADFGDIANLRVVNGTAITPSSSSILEKPTNVTNTVLLMVGGNFVDYSGNAPQINNYYGPPEIKAYGPLDYVEYSATDHGGSVYFDGNGDALTIGNPPTLGANDYTVESWVYFVSSSTGHSNMLTQGPNTTSPLKRVSAFNLLTNGSFNMQTYDGSNRVTHTTSTGNFKLNNWHHVAITHEYNGSTGGTYKFWVDGELVNSGTKTYTNSYYWNYNGIGNYDMGINVYRYNGTINDAEIYYSDYRISDTVRYTSSFTPPTAPLSSSGASLHIKGTDASIIDKSQGNNLKLEGNITGSTTQAKFSNTKSMSFDSVDDLINLNGVLDLSQACTWEAWVYFDNHPDASGFMHMFQSASYSSTDPPFGIRFKTSGSRKIAFVLYTTSSNHEVQSPNPVSLDTWYHLAFSRTSSGVYNVYIDGTRYSTFTESATYQSAGDVMVIGNSGTGSTPARYLDGYMQDIRITQGLARYTGPDETGNIPSAPLEG